MPGHSAESLSEAAITRGWKPSVASRASCNPVRNSQCESVQAHCAMTPAMNDPLRSRKAAMELFESLPCIGFVRFQRLCGFRNRGHVKRRPDIALHSQRYPMALSQTPEIAHTSDLERQAYEMLPGAGPCRPHPA